MIRIAVIAAIVFAAFAVQDVRKCEAQWIRTTYYAPAPSVGYVPVQRGLFGLRTGYVPVVTGTVPVPVTTYYAPAPVTTFYAPTPMTNTVFAPAVPVTAAYAPVAPVTTYYTPVVPRTYTVRRPILVYGW